MCLSHAGFSEQFSKLKKGLSKVEMAACIRNSGGVANCHRTKVGYVTTDMGVNKLYVPTTDPMSLKSTRLTSSVPHVKVFVQSGRMDHDAISSCS